ncbi:protein artichoke [Anabrus simplex]|uniref:protein artichoke n=1 Tax=Anabrus simplex TaxID=316456 RepID=UPI0035A3AC8C
MTALLLLMIAPLALGGYIPPGPRYRCPENSIMLYPCRCVAGGDDGLRARCENSNLASMSVGLSNLASLNEPIEELTFYRCNIGRLYGTMLYPLKVRVLRIEETPLKIIEPFTFFGINRTLQELHIVRTKLGAFPTEAFQVLGNLSLLNIDHHEIQSLPKDAFGSGLLPNSLLRLRITNGLLSELFQETVAPLYKLKVLDLHGNNITTLRKGQFKGLRDTDSLDLSHNAITKIEAAYFADLTKMSWCNLSHNAIADLPRSTFARNAVLLVLNLSHNKLRRLDSNTFRGMRALRRVYLSDNQISDVGRGTFTSLTKIGTIDLARNKIKKIDFQMFHKLQFIELIDVSSNLVTVIEKLAFKELFLVRINVSHNAIEKIESGAFEECSNITLLDLSFNKLKNIPRSAFDSITYATEFNLAYNQFTNLSQIPLHNMTGLKIFNVSFNQMSIIPRNSFPKLYELHTVDLSHNNISEIWNSVFQTLFSLRFLNLSHNSLESIKGSTFGALHTVLELDLSHNKISDINKASLSRLASVRTLSLRHNAINKIFTLPISLSHLDLGHNRVQKIPPRITWPSMNALLSLDLSHNLLENSLERAAFANLLTLQRLNLKDNNISEVPWESLNDLTTLQYVDLSHNQLTQLGRGAFGRLPVVFDLNLAHNKIFNITVRAFEGMLQLLTLNLTANQIKYIPNGAFEGLVSLRTLDLSYNELEKLDNKTHGLLDDCLSLERVNLSHNKISFITRQTFPSSPWVPYRLKEVDLSYNEMPVLTYDIVVGTKKMELLNVSHNLLNEIRSNVLGNLSALRVLDISYNDLTNFPDKSFGPPPNLTTLYMSHNKFSRLPVRELKSLQPKIRLVDVRHNRMSEFPPDLMTLVENGTEFLYTDNDLACNCHARPLRRWMAAQTTLSAAWEHVLCSSPDFLSGHNLASVSEDKMTCDGRDTEKDRPEFDVSPDLKFRDLRKTEQGQISLSWYVPTREDVGDFYLVVRPLPESPAQRTQPILEKDLTYTTRSYVLKELPKNKKLELCLLARDSEGNVRTWRDTQCRVMGEGEDNSIGGGVERSSLSVALLGTAVLVTLSNWLW